MSAKSSDSQQQQQQRTPAKSIPQFKLQGTIPGNRGRAKADELFASSSSQWYAGAAFDRSPDANTLPKPTKLLSAQSASLASSCPTAPSVLQREQLLLMDGQGKAKTRMPTPLMSATMQQKSKDLLSLIRAEPRPPVQSSKAKDEELEEMTRQVRKLLNLS